MIWLKLSLIVSMSTPYTTVPTGRPFAGRAKLLVGYGHEGSPPIHKPGSLPLLAPFGFLFRFFSLLFQSGVRPSHFQSLRDIALLRGW